MMNKDEVLEALRLADTFNRDNGPWKDETFLDIYWSDSVRNIHDVETLVRQYAVYEGLCGVCPQALIIALEYFKGHERAERYIREELERLLDVDGNKVNVDDRVEVCVKCAYGRNICSRDYKLGGNE